MGARSPLHDTVTRTLKLPVLLLPPASVAVQVKVENPSGKNDPEGGVQMAGGASELLVLRAARWLAWKTVGGAGE